MLPGALRTQRRQEALVVGALQTLRGWQKVVNIGVCWVYQSILLLPVTVDDDGYVADLVQKK